MPLVSFLLLCAHLLSTAAVPCDPDARQTSPAFSQYFKGLKSVYGLDDKIYKCYMECGWPNDLQVNNLPTFVVAVGLEGSGQKMMASVFSSVVKADPTLCFHDVRLGCRAILL